MIVFKPKIILYLTHFLTLYCAVLLVDRLFHVCRVHNTGWGLYTPSIWTWPTLSHWCQIAASSSCSGISVCARPLWLLQLFSGLCHVPKYTDLPLLGIMCFQRPLQPSWSVPYFISFDLRGMKYNHKLRYFKISNIFCFH